MPRRHSQLSDAGYQAVLAVSLAGRTCALRALLPLVRAHAPLSACAFWLLLGASAAYAGVQRPWAAAQAVSRLQLLRVCVNSALLLASLGLSLYGLQQSGALLAVLADQMELIVACALGALAADGGALRQPANGLGLMLLGYVTLAIERQAGGFSTRRALGALAAASCLSHLREHTSRRLALGVGGPKRLHALSHAGTLALSAPFALWGVYSHL
ncbi:hypothetical protein T492DRAFT_868360 [Pavlovales sp. CCMP2436]|nr:hypothetical protein T492DRAFT_868360 [Pavlovales sp. CCMP2436]